MKKEVKTARCPHCKKIVSLSDKFFVETDRTALKDFLVLAKSGYEIDYEDKESCDYKFCKCKSYKK